MLAFINEEEYRLEIHDRSLYVHENSSQHEDFMIHRVIMYGDHIEDHMYLERYFYVPIQVSHMWHHF